MEELIALLIRQPRHLERGIVFHQPARVVFHGRRGELRQRYRDGQEDQLGTLGLVVAVGGRDPLDDRVQHRPGALALVAAHVGGTRLIDNLVL